MAYVFGRRKGPPPSAPFGVLKLRQGKSLFVIAEHRPEGRWRETAENALKKIAVTTDPKLLEGDDLAICLMGYTEENSAYMLPLSVRYNPPA